MENLRLKMEPSRSLTRFHVRLTGKSRNLIRDISLRLHLAISLLRDENGQDLIEYALVLALIALAAAAGMSSVASQIGATFNSVGNKLSNYTS